VQYLSDEWIAAADAALSAAWSAVADKGERAVAVRWEVSGAPQGKVAYTMRFGPDGAGVTATPTGDQPDATMAVDYDTAVAIATGAASPQVAFMQGSLKLTGDVMVLLGRAGALESMGDALGAVRERTQF
jgi:hypothetical protein